MVEREIGEGEAERRGEMGEGDADVMMFSRMAMMRERSPMKSPR